MMRHQQWPFGHMPARKASEAARYIAETDFSKYSPFGDVQRELKRYMLIRKVLGRPVAMESKLVDEAWHAFIIDTRNYFAFCEAVFGEYLHHVSDHFKPEPEFDGTYQTLFGEYPGAIWRTELPGDNGFGASYNVDDQNCA